MRTFDRATSRSSPVGLVDVVRGQRPGPDAALRLHARHVAPRGAGSPRDRHPEHEPSLALAGNARRRPLPGAARPAAPCRTAG